MVKLVDTQDLGSCGLGRVGSSPTTRTNHFASSAKTGRISYLVPFIDKNGSSIS